jgi:hypothetical protein
VDKAAILGLDWLRIDRLVRLLNQTKAYKYIPKY